ncbi:galactose mutarotase [Faecalicatena acetigenes]|uniref:Aldose 1-epimerase n=1 Tax=Faecalicatena acetigenes TaxID=2981790 RepID=A0ABT2T7U7_9FIRM|nr:MULTISPECIES: aldose epimerase family protein [Lachnospiraceae]MCU6746320.1 galactose mutarotase [Faecalicatena acetigenes]SCH07404.1 Aldose 1-epimerase precursor [uncultured Clostridium sp.]
MERKNVGTKREFGWTKEGRTVSLYVLQNKNGTAAEITDLGASLVRLWVRDKEGKRTDVVLGYDTPEGYKKGTCFFGAIVGRNANRIAGAQFELNKMAYTLADNDNGNNLHSGTDFYNTRIWETEEYTDSYVRFKLHSPDGDQGFPGNADIYVTYRLDERDTLDIRYEASADKDSLFNLTNHSYFNLDGHDSGSVLGHTLQLEADCFTPGNAYAIPTGEILSAEGTPMDFRNGAKIGARIEEEYEPLHFGNGYDHNWVLKNQGKFEKAAELRGEKSGIVMETYTDRPGIQIYTANYVENEKGKNGAVYGKRSAVCLETQCWPDAVHHENFPSPVCRAGEKYDTHTAFRFSTDKDS